MLSWLLFVTVYMLVYDSQEERDSFGAELLGRAGLVDTWRAQHPGIVGYTYYSYRFNMREKGKGWRLDYFLVSNRWFPRYCCR